MDQIMVNWVLGIAGMLAGFIIRALWQSVKDLRKEDKELAKKVNSIEVLVAGQYVHVDRFDQLSTAIFTKLDRIEDKLDAKADKEHPKA